MQEIQDERVRELFAEGNRLFDMKRWKIGMKRSSSDAQREDYLPALGTDIEKKLQIIVGYGLFRRMKWIVIHN